MTNGLMIKACRACHSCSREDSCTESISWGDEEFYSDSSSHSQRNGHLTFTRYLSWSWARTGKRTGTPYFWFSPREGDEDFWDYLRPLTEEFGA